MLGLGTVDLKFHTCNKPLIKEVMKPQKFLLPTQIFWITTVSICFKAVLDSRKNYTNIHKYFQRVPFLILAVFTWWSWLSEWFTFTNVIPKISLKLLTTSFFLPVLVPLPPHDMHVKDTLLCTVYSKSQLLISWISMH